MRRALKISAWALAASGVIALLLVCLVWVAGNTPAGRTWIESLTYRLTGGVVKLSGLGGSFPVDLTLDELELRDAGGVWLTAQNVAVRWSPLELLKRRIVVDQLRAVRVHMERTPRGGQGGGSASIPHIEVGQFAIDNVELGAPLAGAAVTLSAHGSRLEMRSLEDASGDLVARRKDGDGDYTFHLKLDPARVDAWLIAHEPAGGPLENLLSLPGLGPLSARITLAGPHHAALIDAVVDAGGLHGQVKGSVDFSHGVCDLNYSLAAPAMAPRADVAWERLALEGKWRGALTTPAAQGSLDVEGLRLAGTTRVLRLSAQLAAGAGTLTVHSAVDGLEIPGPQPRLFAGAPVRIDASLRLNQPSRPFDLVAAHPLFKLRAQGELTTAGAGGQRASVELQLPDIAPIAAFAAQDARGDAAINAQLTHGSAGDAVSLEAYLGLSGGTAPWIGAVGPRANIKLSGSLSNAGFEIRNLRLVGGALTLTASGSAQRAAPDASLLDLKELEARWQLDVADLGRLSSDLAGDLRSSGKLSGSSKSMVADAALTTRLSVRGSAPGTIDASLLVRGLPRPSSASLRAHGVVDGAPLLLDAAMDRGADRTVRVSIRQADWKSAHADGDITADPALTQSRGELRLRIGQLADFNRLLQASIAGSVQGNLGFVPSGGRSQAHLDLDGTDIAAGPLAGNVQLHAAGMSNAIDVQLTAQLPKFYGMPAGLAASGTLNMDARELAILNISADYRSQNFRLLSPARLSFAQGMSVDDVKIGAQSAVFELSGILAPQLDLHATLQHLRPDLVNVFVPGLLADGDLEAETRLEGSVSGPTGSATLDATGVRFANDAATGLPAVAVHAKAQLGGDDAALTATLSGGAGSQLNATGTAPLAAGGALNIAIGGKLDVGLANAFLEARGLRAAGALSVDATVTGSSAAPQVGGEITLADGSLRDYARGVNLSEINAQVLGGDGGLQIKSFKARAISGSLTMSGTIGILEHGMPVDLKITARNAQPVASSIITANLDADLRVSGTALERLDVSGAIHVNRANIGIPDSLPPNVAVLDVRRRGQGAPVSNAAQLVVGLDVDINAPQQVLVQGRGLNADMAGDIKLTGTSAEPVATGSFALQRGSFTIAGNQLSFTQGTVGFDGAGLRKKIDPTLDFTAATSVTGGTSGDATVTLRITGVADAPEFEFTSIPSLPPDEIMALLLFGKPASQLTGLEVAQIGAALATLSGVGGGSNPLVKLQKSLGLDRLTVGSNTTTSATGAVENNGAAIAAGRYVTKRVYVEAKQTTAGTSQVQVDVDLTKHLKLQTRLGNGTAAVQGTTPENDPGSGVGISYQFEF